MTLTAIYTDPEAWREALAQADPAAVIEFDIMPLEGGARIEMYRRQSNTPILNPLPSHRWEFRRLLPVLQMCRDMPLYDTATVPLTVAEVRAVLDAEVSQVVTKGEP